MPNINVIVNFSKSARYAFNVLVGALAEKIADTRLRILTANDKRTLARLLAERDREVQTVVLWSFYSPQFAEQRHHLQQLKGEFDHHNLLHLAGGVHASAEPLQTLQAGFDYVAVGEGEQILVDFINCLLSGRPLNEIKGIAYQHDGQLVRHGRGELIDLNDYPPFAPQHHMFGAIEITRGCIYACKFCQTPYVSKARFRHRNIDNIVHYAALMRDHGFRDYRFISPTSLSYGSPDDRVNLAAIEALLSRMRETIGDEARLFFGTFPSEIRPEHISREALHLIRRYADNDNLIIGGQSGSQRILDSSKRGHSVEAVVQAVKLCVDEGFLPNVDFLFGLPGETPDDVQQTLDLAQTLGDLGAKIHNHTFMPLPGTPFKNADAGQVGEQAQQVIFRMESSGKAYGKWKSQIDTARELVDVRDEQRVQEKASAAAKP